MYHKLLDYSKSFPASDTRAAVFGHLICLLRGGERIGKPSEARLRKMGPKQQPASNATIENDTQMDMYTR
jgi:hypothetical protein